MTLEFRVISFDDCLYDAASKEALKNWKWWEKDFSRPGNVPRRFCEMPVLKDYPRFRGFGADYSVFRGLTADQTDKLRECLLEQPDPDGLKDLFKMAGKRLGGKRRISLFSKLLAMWKPERFAMWDTLARNGLKRVHSSTGGHCYNENTIENYQIFNDDFFALYSSRSDKLTAFAELRAREYQQLNTELFSYRILDNVLMKLGKM